MNAARILSQAKIMLRKVQAKFDKAQAQITPSSLLALITTLLALGVFLTTCQIAVDWREFWSRKLCFGAACTNELMGLLEEKALPLFISAKISLFIAALIAPYIALKHYISTSSAQVFGNHIAHIGFFERFLRSEIAKRDRISPTSVDIYSIYRLMFPQRGESYLSEDFKEKAEAVKSVILTSNETRSETPQSFKFEVHQRKMIAALRQLGISAASTPRMDFLETEDQVLDLLEMLLWVFSEQKEMKASFFPARGYR